MSEIQIRRATETDLPAAAELRWQWLLELDQRPQGSREDYIAYLTEWARSAPGHECFLAARGDAVIGMAWLAITDRVPSAAAFDRRSGDLQSVYVLAAERHHGVGGQLVHAVATRAAELGLEHLTVHARALAIDLYQRHGFAMQPQLMLLKPGG
ncbi:GNAT family N-acetyltransferase [Micromonospora sp. NPDC049366]|uniref:GNAT family N-acetyltransferase n=1 Tax=Micromonospora sp. NPDC049366 TaxID=3364271 RepID=UPI00378E38BC